MTKNDFIGIGASGMLDRAGELDFGSDQSKALVSYIRQMAKDSLRYCFFSVGLDLGVTKRRVDLNNPRWASQHNGQGGFDPLIPGPDIDVLSFSSDFYHAAYLQSIK